MKFIYLLLIASISQAQVVLIPEKTVPLETYLTKCHVEGYQCTQDYFKSLLIKTESEAFENFLENIDLYNEDYRRNLYPKLKKILSEENISLEQAELLLQVIKKSEGIEKNVSLTEIKNEILDLIPLLENLPEEKSDHESFLILKKIISKKQYTKIKYKIKYTKVTRITPYTEPTLAENYLLEGTCDSPNQSTIITQHSTLLFNEDCGSIFTSTTDLKLSDYQKPIIYTALAAVAVLFLSQYEVQVQY